MPQNVDPRWMFIKNWQKDEETLRFRKTGRTISCSMWFVARKEYLLKEAMIIM